MGDAVLLPVSVPQFSTRSCSLFCKALGIVIAAVVLWNAFKLLRWALAVRSSLPNPIAFLLICYLQDGHVLSQSIPVFGSSLGCLTAPHIYNQSSVVFYAPIDPQSQDHAFEIRGSAVGTFTVAQGAPGSDDVMYEMTLRTDDPALLQDVHIQYPDNKAGNPRFMITTPMFGTSSACMRFDITMYVPPRLKKLSVSSHTAVMHIQFDEKSDVVLDKLYVTTFSMSKNNMILSNTHVRGKSMSLEVLRGWIIGDVAVLDNTRVTTQRADGIANLRVHPVEHVDPESQSPASFMTVTGAGRTDIFYITPKAFQRPIHNVHMSSRNADVYLTYNQAKFNGRIAMESAQYSASGLEALPKSANEDTSEDESEYESATATQWTHWRGDKNGGDEIVVKSRGWTGLYF